MFSPIISYLVFTTKKFTPTPSEADKMSTRNFWKLNGEKETASLNWLQPSGS